MQERTTAAQAREEPVEPEASSRLVVKAAVE
jgi:hypothetical protein